MTYWHDDSPTAQPRSSWGWGRTALAVAIVVAVVAGGIGTAVVTPKLFDAAVMTKYTEPIDWYGCGGGMSCAQVDAPLDWGSVTSPTIRLALIKHRATGTRTGTLLVNPGGPGGSGVDMVGSDVRNAVTASVARHTDVIGFDPRGVGHSTAVRCGGDAALDRRLYPGVTGAVGSDEWVRAERTAARAFARGCAQRSGELLAHIDTMSAARDLELIRRDLGEPRLDYLGYSYGTELGSIYAGLYPHRVGRFVLDGAVDLWSTSDGFDGSDDSDGSDAPVGQARGFDGALRDWMTACVAQADSAVPAGGACPYTGSVDDGMTAVGALLDRVSAEPLGVTDGRRMDGSTLATGISEALYDERSWPRLTVALGQAEAGDASGAMELADEYNGRDAHGRYDGNTTEAFTAIQCVDYGGASIASMRRTAAAYRKAAPTLGPYVAFDFSCDGWGAAPTTSYPEPPVDAGDGPVLVVGTTKDPATPYADAKSLARLFPDGRLVTERGEGHTAYNLDDRCVDRVVDAYLLHGTAPSRDPRCRG